MKSKNHLKILFLLLIILLSINSIAQENHTCGELIHSQQEKYTCKIESHYKGKQHLKSQEFTDRFGKSQCKTIGSNLSLSQRLLEAPDYITPEGLFAICLTPSDITEDNFTSNNAQGSAFRDVLAQVFADVEALIVENNPNNIMGLTIIDVQSFSEPVSTLAAGGSQYNLNGLEPGSITEGEVWKAINSGENTTDEWDGRLRVNFNHLFFTDFNNPTNINNTQFDMYSVLLHEIVHALGFASGINANGMPSSSIAYFPFDTRLHDINEGDLLIATTPNTWQFNTAIDITSGCPNSAIRIDNNIPVHSPQFFSGGSSLSHIDFNNDCNYPSGDYLMTAGINRGDLRNILQDEVNILCNLNYTTSGNYGHPNIVPFPTTGNIGVPIAGTVNQRARTLAACDPSVFANNDILDVTGNPYTVVNCPDNMLALSENILLNNDLGTGIQIVNLMTLDGTLIPVDNTTVAPNRVYNFDPETGGTTELRYQIQDSNGNISNFAIVTIDVSFCPGFGCTSENTCNLICNSEITFEDRENTNCVTLGVNDDSIYTIPGWRPKFGSPDWILDDSEGNNCVLPGVGDNRNLTHLPNPEISSGRHSIVGSQRRHPFNNNINFFQTEATMTNLSNIQPNRRYLLSYHKSDGNNPTSIGEPAIGGIPTLNVGLDVSLGNNDRNNTSHFLLHNRTTNEITNNSGPISLDFLNNKVPIIIDNTAANSNWSQTVTIFDTPLTVDDDNSFLIFSHAIDEAYVASGRPYADIRESYIIQIDRIELIEDRLQQTPQNYVLSCSSSQAIGIDLCDVAGLQYEWWDVTNNIQLTDLDDTTGNYTDGIINTLPPAANYTIASINENGSIITLANVMSSVDLELRRTFPEVFINESDNDGDNEANNNIIDPNNIAAVTITVDNGIPTDAPFTTTLIDCNSHTFTANSIFDTHEWEIRDSDDNILQTIGPGPGTEDIFTEISFNFPENGDYIVNHTVYNECGSFTETEAITVLCSDLYIEKAAYTLDNPDAQISQVYADREFEWRVTIENSNPNFELQYEDIFPDKSNTACGFTINSIDVEGASFTIDPSLTGTVSLPVGTIILHFNVTPCNDSTFSGTTYTNCFNYINPEGESISVCDDVVLFYGCPAALSDGYCLIPTEDLEQGDILTSELNFHADFSNIIKIEGDLIFNPTVFNTNTAITDILQLNPNIVSTSINYVINAPGHITFSINTNPFNIGNFGSGFENYTPLSVNLQLTNNLNNCTSIHLDGFRLTQDNTEEIFHIRVDEGVYCDNFDISDYESAWIVKSPEDLCNDGSVELTAIGPFDSQNPATTYLWSTGETSQSITVDENADYSVSINDNFNCERFANYLVEDCFPADCECGDLNPEIIYEIRNCSVKAEANIQSCPNISMIEYIWQFSNGTTFYGQSPPIQNFAGSYGGIGSITLKIKYRLDNNFNECTEKVEEIFFVACRSIDKKNRIAISLYPNPSKDYITVDINIKKGTIKLVNLFGVTISKIKYDKTEDSNKHIFNTSKLNTGVYFIEFTDEVGLTEVKSFVKM